MEEEKTVSLEELIELIKEPIEIESETFGTMYFRHIHDNDYLFIEKCLDEKMDQEIFCKQFLINQIDNPIFTLDDFNDIDCDEIYSILKRYLEIEDLLDYFDFDSSNNVFTIFNEGMKNYRNNVNSIIVGNQLSLLNSANSLINSFNFHDSLTSHLNRINEISIGAMSQTSKILTSVNKIATPDINSHVSQLVNSSAILSAANLMETINKQIAIWENWITSNSIIFNQITKNIILFWDKFQIDYQIPSLDAQKCLKKYHWFISPNMRPYIVYKVMEVFNSSSRHKRREINNLFINYFLDNNCRNLDEMIEKWALNPIFNGRIKIIKDCINLLKNDKLNINYSNLIVPTLIPQIEGIQMEFMKLNGLTVNYGKVCTLDGQLVRDENGNEVYKKDYFRQLTSENELFDAMNDIFLDVLFQKTQPGEEYLSIHFSRHKILHGENIHYGRKDYMIRCFMILDFLSELMFINQ